MKSSEECSSQSWTQCIPEKKKKRKNGISLKSWIFFRLLAQLHKLTLQLRGLFTWMKCKSLKWCPLICFSVRTKKSFDTLISDTLPTAFYYRLAMFLRASERTKTKKKRKHKMLFSWFSILFMARFMDLWWNARNEILEYIFSVCVNSLCHEIHCHQKKLIGF